MDNLRENIIFNRNGEMGGTLDLKVDDNMQDFGYAEFEW